MEGLAAENRRSDDLQRLLRGCYSLLVDRCIWKRKIATEIQKSKFGHLQCAVSKGLSRVTLITCQITNSQRIGKYEKSAKGQNRE